MKNNDMVQQRDQISPRKVILTVLVIIGVGLGFWVLFRYHLVFFSLFEAIVFSTAITPIVNWLSEKGLPKYLGVSLIYLLLIAIIIASFFAISPLIGDEGVDITRILSGYYRDLRNTMIESPSILLNRIGYRLPPTLLFEPVETPEEEEDPLERVTEAINVSGSVFRGIFTTLTVLLLTLYWTLDKDRILRSGVMLIPITQRDSIRDFLAASEERVGAYIRGLGFLSLAVGALSIAAYLLIGLPYALLLGIIAGIFEIIPLIGPILGAFPALLVAVAIAPDKVIWVVAATVFIQLVENNLLVPKVMNKAVGVNPIVGLLAFLSFSSLFGLAGAVLAIPLAVVIQLILNRSILDPDTITPSSPTGRDPISALRYDAIELVQDVRKRIRDKEEKIDSLSDQIEDAIEEIANDLDSILAKAEDNANGKVAGS